jgi:hypothetical protein
MVGNNFDTASVDNGRITVAVGLKTGLSDLAGDPNRFNPS